MLRCAITDRTLFPNDSSAHPFHALVARCATLAQEGIDLLLIREKDLPAGPLIQLSREILAAVRHSNLHTQVLIASRPDIALAAGADSSGGPGSSDGADGVHLSSHLAELTPTQIRTLYSHAARPEPVITISCHTIEEVRSARTCSPTAILFAPVFGKRIAGREVTPAAGLKLLAEACRIAAPIPVLALGGVTAANTASCLEAGAAGIAAIRLFINPPKK